MQTFTIEEKVQVMDTPALRDEYRRIQALCVKSINLHDPDYSNREFNVDVRTMMLVDGVRPTAKLWVVYAHRWNARTLDCMAQQEWDEAERLQEQNWGCDPRS